MDTWKAKEVLLNIKVVLNKARLKFWLVDGIALGAVRDKAIIPYDTDLDLRVMAKGFDMSTVVGAFKDARFHVRVSHNKRLYGDLPSGIILYKRGIKTDMCLGYYHMPDDKIVVLAGRPAKDISVLPAGLFWGNHYVKFLGTSFRIPYPTAEYFSLLYGKDWEKPTHAKYPHPAMSIAKYVDYFHEGNK